MNFPSFLFHYLYSYSSGEKDSKKEDKYKYYLVYYSFILFFGVLDVGTTYIHQVLGREEGNVLLKILFEGIGLELGMILFIAYKLVLITWFRIYQQTTIILILTIISTIIVLHNSIVIGSIIGWW